MECNRCIEATNGTYTKFSHAITFTNSQQLRIK